MIGTRFPLRKEHAQVVKWTKAPSLTSVASVKIPVMYKSMLEVNNTQMTIGNYEEIGIGFAWSFSYSDYSTTRKF